jgi:HK97 gp10 family phage protein
VDVSLSGVKLEKLSPLVKGALESSLSEMSNKLEQTMKEEVPVRTGYLQASITKDVMGLEARVGPTANYAGYVEMGTRPHLITPVNATVLAWESPTGQAFAKFVRHPGTIPNPFTRRTREYVLKDFNLVFMANWERVLGKAT